jgi:hypothetical protein
MRLFGMNNDPSFADPVSAADGIGWPILAIVALLALALWT